MSGPWRWRHTIYLVVGLVAASIAVPLYREAAANAGDLWHVGPFLGSILVTVGWVVTSETAIRNSKRQHTIALITNHIGDPARAANRKIIQATLITNDTRLTPPMLTASAPAGTHPFDNTADPLLVAIDSELNFYEFAAAGIVSDDIDETLLRNCLRGQFCTFYAQTDDYIRHWRAKRAQTWEYIAAMNVRWSR